MLVIKRTHLGTNITKITNIIGNSYAQLMK